MLHLTNKTLSLETSRIAMLEYICSFKHKIKWKQSQLWIAGCKTSFL